MTFVLLTSHTVFKVRPCYSIYHCMSFLFYGWIIFNFMTILQFASLLISWWTFGLFPPFGTFVYTSLFEHPFSVLLSMYPGAAFVGHIGILGLPYGGASRWLFSEATPLLTSISHVPISPHCHQHFLFVLFCRIHPWCIWSGVSLWFWFAFLWWLMMFSIFLCVWCLFLYLFLALCILADLIIS